MGFFSVEQGVEFVEQIKPITKSEGVVLIANMGLAGDLKGRTEEEALKRTADLARKLKAAGADMIEVSRSCPIEAVALFGHEWTMIQDAEYIEKIVKTLKAAVRVPFFLKLRYPVTIENVGRFEDAGVAAHSFASSAPGVVIDIEAGRPIVPFPLPYHGRGSKALQNYQVAKLALKAQRPLMPSSGTMNSRDVIERLMCGATITQVQTASEEKVLACIKKTQTVLPKG